MEIVKVEEKAAIAGFRDAVEEMRLIQDSVGTGKAAEIMGAVLEQKGNAEGGVQPASPVRDRRSGRLGERQGQGNADIAFTASIVHVDRLEVQMLAVPRERPFLLERLQHRDIMVVPAARRSDRQFDAMDDDGEAAADIPCGFEQAHIEHHAGRSIAGAA